MSVRVATDAFGRSINLPQLPFTTIEPHAGPDYDKEFINADGDEMEGELNMNKHKLSNLATPKDKLDAANKEYVDNIKTRVLATLQNNFKDTTDYIQKKIKKNRDQDIALKEIIKKLSRKVESDTQIKQIQGTIANTKNIPTLIIPWDSGYSMTKNIVLLQMLIQSDNDCWLDIQSLGYQYGLHIFERLNKKTKKYELHISSNQKLPSNWKRNVIIFVRILHRFSL